MKFKQITVQGAPYERGRSCGQQCREEISITVRVYQMLFDGLKNFSWEDAREIAKQYLELTCEFCDHYGSNGKLLLPGTGQSLGKCL